MLADDHPMDYNANRRGSLGTSRSRGTVQRVTGVVKAPFPLLGLYCGASCRGNIGADKTIAFGLKGLPMGEEHTTAVVQRYLNELNQDSPAEPIVRALLDGAVRRLHLLCATLLYRSYPRLAQPPLNLQADELLSSVTERLLKALREARPGTVRQFFALANQHMRWELNDLARRLDNQPAAVELREGLVPAAASSASGLSPNGRRMLEAIENLPDEEREAFGLVRVQGMTQTEAAQLLGVSVATVKRRLFRGLRLLTEKLADLRPGDLTGEESHGQ
jgi:RNA polymerase sigma factor (sigma-70 family)